MTKIKKTLQMMDYIGRADIGLSNVIRGKIQAVNWNLASQTRVLFFHDSRLLGCIY